MSSFRARLCWKTRTCHQDNLFEQTRIITEGGSVPVSLQNFKVIISSLYKWHGSMAQLNGYDFSS
jgi:hypothetical protein